MWKKYSEYVKKQSSRWGRKSTDYKLSQSMLNEVFYAGELQGFLL